MVEGKYLVITIDTECDKGENWRIKKPLSFIGIYKGVGEYLQGLFSNLGIKPTYLISPEVMRDHKSVKILLDAKKEGSELGTHLHGEFIEPNMRPNATSTSEYAHNYSDEMEFQKLKNLTELFKSTFGFKPVSYRAGRFSISERTFNFLKSLDYKIDTSFAPFSRISDINHENKPPYPHFIKGILEIPITILPKNWKLWKVMRNSPLYSWRKFRKFALKFGPVWLRPSTTNWKDMLELVDRYEKMSEYPIIINLFLHNVEVVENLSPYDADYTRNNLENFLKRILDKGYVSLRLYDVWCLIKGHKPESSY